MKGLLYKEYTDLVETRVSKPLKLKQNKTNKKTPNKPKSDLIRTVNAPCQVTCAASVPNTPGLKHNMGQSLNKGYNSHNN